MALYYADCIEYIYPNIKPDQYSLRDDGEGVYIASWSYPEKQPTLDMLKAVNEKACRQSCLKHIRQERNQRLAACDWTQLPDSSVAEKWKAYRKALRDFPANCDPENPVWPISPDDAEKNINDTEIKSLVMITEAYNAYKNSHPDISLSEYLDTMQAFVRTQAPASI